MKMDVKELRKMADLTQFELAQQCGISRMKLSLVECQQIELSPEEEAEVRSVLFAAIKTRAAKIQGLLSGRERERAAV